MIDGLKLDPLSIIDTDTLIAELKNRYPRGLLVAGLAEEEGDTQNEYFYLDWAHGLSVCIGLAERAKARLIQRALGPDD